MKKQLTLCIVYQEGKVLLGMKKRGFGAGRWNGFGGKVEAGETVKEAAMREVKEEVGIVPKALDEAGILEFSFENDPKILEVHVFMIREFTGEPLETEEMRPEWFEARAIPYDMMWSDDIYWLPMVLEGKKVRGKFLFDRPSDAEYSAKIITQELEEAR